MRPLRRCFIRLGFVVCVGAIVCGCGPRKAPAPPTAPAAPPELPATSVPPAAAPAPTVPAPEAKAASPEPAPSPVPLSPSTALAPTPAPAPAPTLAAGSIAAAKPAEAADRDCEVVPEPGEPITSIALTEMVDPAHAPHPTNDSERLLFRQVYETLVRVDCRQRVRPGLASSWQLDPDGRTWIVTLREDARFSDGSPVTPADIVASWTPTDPRRPQVNPYVQSIAPVGDRTLAITLRDTATEAPLVLGHAGLAIAKPSDDSPWPLGTRGTRAAFETLPEPGGRSTINVSELSVREAVADIEVRPWTIRFIVSPGTDHRDLLDRRIDLLLTRDAATLNYAATLPEFQSAPLAWNRTRVFASPWRDRSVAPPTAEARQTLALDALRGEARGAQEPFWWQALASCEIAHPRPRNPPAPGGRIVYERDDNDARDLAERLVALARAAAARPPALIESLLPRAAGNAFQRTGGLTAEAFAAAVERGTEAGYILAIESRPLEPCAESRRLAERMRWLDTDALVPLVDTRLRAIVRRGRAGLTAEWDAGLVVARPPRVR